MALPLTNLNDLVKKHNEFTENKINGLIPLIERSLHILE
jgi:hypothetical protein